MTISPKYRRRLVVMLKEPRPGRVKTRLGRDIGMVPAAWWFRHQTIRLLRNVQSAGWETVLAVSPDVEGLQSRIWPRHLPRWPQGSGDLGDRMLRIFDKMPPGPLIIIGADIPGISRVHIKNGFALLGSADAVFGPSEDGGFWLVGLNRNRPRPKSMFRDVRWSTGNALGDSVKSMSGSKIALADTLKDVDTSADL